MIHPVKTFLSVFSFILIAHLLAVMDEGRCETERPGQKIVGGPCRYTAYRGKAIITSIVSKGLSGVLGGPTYEGYEVKYRFVPEEEINGVSELVRGKEYVLLLSNSWYPGPRFLEKYHIELGKSFDCLLNVIKEGSCTPLFFDFPALDLTDYFESKDP